MSNPAPRTARLAQLVSALSSRILLLDGAMDEHGNSYESIVDTHVAAGVKFRVCNNTLVARKIDASKVAMEAKIVPSGVAEVARLQAREGFVYLRP